MRFWQTVNSVFIQWLGVSGYGSSMPGKCPQFHQIQAYKALVAGEGRYGQAQKMWPAQETGLSCIANRIT